MLETKMRQKIISSFIKIKSDESVPQRMDHISEMRGDLFLKFKKNVPLSCSYLLVQYEPGKII